MIDELLGGFTSVKVLCALEKPPVLKNEFLTVFIKLVLGITLIAN